MPEWLWICSLSTVFFFLSWQSPDLSPECKMTLPPSSPLYPSISTLYDVREQAYVVCETLPSEDLNTSMWAKHWQPVKGYRTCHFQSLVVWLLSFASSCYLQDGLWYLQILVNRKSVCTKSQGLYVPMVECSFHVFVSTYPNPTQTTS